jgi:hypothetical protein
LGWSVNVEDESLVAPDIALPGAEAGIAKCCNLFQGAGNTGAQRGPFGLGAVLSFKEAEDFR